MAKDNKTVNLDALALTGPDLPIGSIVVDARTVSRGDVVDMVIGQCEDALKAKVKALNAEANKLLTLTADEIRSMMTDKPLVLSDMWGVKEGRAPSQLYVNVEFPKTGPVAARFQRAGKLLSQAEAYQQALNDLVHGKSAKRAILKKFLAAHPEGKAAIEQIEKFGEALLKGLTDRVAGQLVEG